MIRLISLSLLIFLAAPLLATFSTSVVIQEGGDAAMRSKTEKNLTDVLNACNRMHESEALPEDIRSLFVPGAFESFQKLATESRMFANEPEYSAHLITTTAGDYEVRNIKVRVASVERSGVPPYQYLVFTLNDSGEIKETKFTIEKQRYQEIVEQGKALNDLAYREKILHFVELYRTAYNKKDSTFIERTLSDDALIIVGNVVQVKDENPEYLNRSYLDDEQIQFLLLEKKQYMRRLKRAFRNNEFVQINFDHIKINQHPRFDQVYGVQLKQRWNSSTYSDEGFLFLMMDFVQPEEPIVHVRAWQPDRFEDGSTVSIFDFDIIE